MTQLSLPKLAYQKDMTLKDYNMNRTEKKNFNLLSSTNKRNILTA